MAPMLAIVQLFERQGAYKKRVLRNAGMGRICYLPVFGRAESLLPVAMTTIRLQIR